MLLLLIVRLAALCSLAAAGLVESSGFHCRMQHSLKMNRKTHGLPRTTNPPFEFSIEDTNGTIVKYYEPGQTYIVKLVGLFHYRGLLMQPRLTDQSGFLIGSLKGGQFIEEDIWEFYGIRFQDCDASTHSNDSITHKSDAKKFITKVKWTTDRDVGPVQFLMTLAQSNEVYWERWRPRSGFIVPESLRDANIQIADTIFDEDTGPEVDEEEALAFFAGNTSSVRYIEIAGLSKVNGDGESEEKEYAEIKGNITNPVLVYQWPPPPSKIDFELSLAKLPTRVRQRLNDRLKLLQGQETGSKPRTTGENKTKQPLVVFNKGINSTLGADGPEKQSVQDSKQESTESTLGEEANSLDTIQKLNDLLLTPLDLSDIPVAFKSGTFTPKLAKAIGSKGKNSINIESCKTNPCKNGGNCTQLEGASKESSEKDEHANYLCACPIGWIGKNCQNKDFCPNHKCEHGRCRSGARNYTCECVKGFAGKFCNRKCPADICENGGKCIEKADGTLGCQCVPGTKGAKCEIDIDECAARPCKHGGSCKNTKLNNFECTCTPGWMGKTCDRPCQDVYKSCEVWKNQHKCKLMRTHTTFFDLNCAVSCDQCVFLNKTIRTSKPLPPVLIPLAWTLGVWTANIRSRVNYPFDFNGTKAQYNEVITFVVSDVLMFGTPSINFTSVAVNKDDPSDQHVQNGYLTIRPEPSHDLKAALLTTSNHASEKCSAEAQNYSVSIYRLCVSSRRGLLMIEEGPIIGNGVQFAPHFQSSHPSIVDRTPKEMRRMFSKSGPLLLQSIMKRNADGKIQNISKYFTRVLEFEYL